MTIQVPDYVALNGEIYILAGSDESAWLGLPKPEDFGIQPFTWSTAVGSGYYMLYALEQQQLWLRNMYVRTADDVYPLIGNVAATPSGRMHAYKYANLNLPIAASGHILLGRGARPSPLNWLALLTQFMELLDVTLTNGVPEITDVTPLLDNLLAEPAPQDVFRFKHQTEVVARYGIPATYTICGLVDTFFNHIKIL